MSSSTCFSMRSSPGRGRLLISKGSPGSWRRNSSAGTPMCSAVKNCAILRRSFGAGTSSSSRKNPREKAAWMGCPEVSLPCFTPKTSSGGHPAAALIGRTRKKEFRPKSGRNFGNWPKPDRRAPLSPGNSAMSCSLWSILRDTERLMRRPLCGTPPDDSTTGSAKWRPWQPGKTEKPIR